MILRTEAIGACAVCALAVALAPSCTLVNKIDACDVEPAEYRVNQRGDQSEFPSHPRAAARLIGNNRIIITYVAQPTDASSSQVRIAMLDATSGNRYVVCKEDFEYTLSDPSVVAYAASVAAVDFPFEGLPVKAVVGWIEGYTDSHVKIVFVDDRGCPMNQPFSPLVDPTIPTTGLSMAWSPTKKKLLTAYHDHRRVLTTWVDDPNPPPPTEIATHFYVNDIISAVIADDGRGALAWSSYADLDKQNARIPDLDVALLDSEGNVRPGPSGAAAPFGVVFPGTSDASGTSDLTFAAENDRYALAASLSISAAARPVVYVTELSASDGSTLSPPIRVEPENGAAHYYPSMAYETDGSLFVAWEAPNHGGTMARLYAPGEKPRFTSVACDDTPFATGVRAKQGLQGQPSVVVSGNDLWVFHPGQPSYDAYAMGVSGWRIGFDELWPKK